MTIIQLESLLDIRPDVIYQWAKRNARVAKTIEESTGYFRIEVLPDLTASQKTILQVEINKIGRGSVT